MEYYILLEQLNKIMCTLNEVNREDLYAVLKKLCILLRVDKGVISFYQSPTHEKLGRGDTFVCYDSGKPSVEKRSIRMFTSTMMIGISSVYQEEGAEPWTEEESERIEMIQNMMLLHLNKVRLGAVVEKLTFLDDDGYFNSRYFVSNLEKLGHAGSLKGKVVFRFNLRHFSLINHQIGRAAGDLAMRNFFSLVQETGGEGCIAARMGGDNFLLLCDEKNRMAVEKVLLGAPVVFDSNTSERVAISATAGAMIIPEHFEFSEANDIMDKVTSTFQDASRNNVEILYCDDDMMAEKERIMRIQQLFPIALEREEFLVYYQPKIDVFGNVLAGAEALCRWYHGGKIVPPLEFIPVLERNFDICKLDFYMLDHVCQDIRRWLDEGKEVVRVSVNLSRKHMMDADLYNRIVEIVDRNNVPHKYIEIELTETTTDVEFRDLKRVVNGLQSSGIFTSVDDFGIGYSSLNLIREIPWNVLKVDKSFLPTESENEMSRSSVMFKHVVAMAHELGLECVAEGVETKEQISLLKKNSCNIAQGFYFDRPLPVEDFEKRLEARRY